MRIVQICHITREGGGIESYVKNLLFQLPKIGLNVLLIGFDPNYNSSESYSYIQITSKNNRWIYLINLWIKSLFLNLSSSDIIHAHRLDDMFPFVLFYKSNPKVCTLHGKTVENIRIKHSNFTTKVYEIIEKITLKKLIKQNSRLIAVDKLTKQFYVKRYPWLKDKIIVIPVGVDTIKFKPLDKKKMLKKYKFSYDDKIIMYIGRLEKEKNLDFLLRSFVAVRNRFQQAKLVLVGDGRERKNLERLAKGLDLTENIYFLGSVEHSKIPELLNCADVFVLCSLYEGSPTVIKEAIACGVPVVSTDVGDISKTIKDEIGKIVKGDEKNFAKNIIKMISMDRNKIRDKFTQVAKGFSIDHMVDEIVEKVYKDVTKNSEGY